MKAQIALCILVCSPNGRKAGGLCGHNIHAVPVIGAHGSHARSHKLHYFILHIAVLKYRADDRQRNILRSHAGHRLSRQINGHNARIRHIVSVAQQLLYQLAAALAYSHGAQSAIAGVAVGTQDHLSASGHHLTHILMDYRNMRRNIDAAVFFCSRKAEHVVILIDGAAYRTQRIMAVGQHIGNGELFHAGCLCRLDDSHKSNIMRSHGIEAKL